MCSATSADKPGGFAPQDKNAGKNAAKNPGKNPGRFGIALDWGTTNLRAFLLDDRGNVVEQRERPWGILSLPAPAAAGGFDQALEGIVADWLTTHPDANLIASGMVGSQQGWLEAPYVRCPAGADRLASHMARVRSALGREMMIVPGVLFDQPEALPDVIRGEETQVFGALHATNAEASDAARCFVLPGTHSKWVLVENRRIVQFATYMTGELYATLRQHSILGRLMTTPAGDDSGDAGAAAAYGWALALARDSGPGDLMRHLFTARSLNLAGRLPATALADYLSGLLIGHELVSATAWLTRQAGASTPIVLIGEDVLLARYRAALAAFGLGATAIGNTAAAGLHHLLSLARAGSADPRPLIIDSP